MELIKYKSSEILFHIRHDLRELPDEKSYGNESINPDLTKNNYSLVDRGKTAEEINQYRKDLEKEIFKYNRKNLVHAIEAVVQCPDDCPPEQHQAFFEAVYGYFCETLPMGEKCIFLAEVHTDEKHYSPSGEMISKEHLHLMYVPGVKDDKHDGFQYRLCADQLTKKARMKELHPNLQKYLNKHGIQATVYQKKDGSGKTIPLTVKQLKTITEKTGITLDHSLTVDELVKILNADIVHGKKAKALEDLLHQKEKEHTALLSKLDDMKQKLANADKTIFAETDALEKSDQENAALREKITALEEKIKSLEKQHTVQAQTEEKEWGHSAEWGRSEWDKTNVKEEEKLW